MYYTDVQHYLKFEAQNSKYAIKTVQLQEISEYNKNLISQQT